MRSSPRIVSTVVMACFVSLLTGCPWFESRKSADHNLKQGKQAPATPATSQPIAASEIDHAHRFEYASFYDVKRFDIDDDGTPELILHSSLEGVQIIDRSGKSIETVDFQTRSVGMFREAWPVRLDGEVYWVVSLLDYRGRNERADAILQLHSRKGRFLWEFRLETPAEFREEPTILVEAARLRDAVECELVVAWNYERPFEDQQKLAAAGVLEMKKTPAQLVILDTRTGKLLWQRKVADTIHVLDFFPATMDEPASIRFGSDDQLVSLSAGTLRLPRPERAAASQSATEPDGD